MSTVALSLLVEFWTQQDDASCTDLLRESEADGGRGSTRLLVCRRRTNPEPAC